MSLETNVPRTRRALLGAAVGAAAATVASALGRPLPAAAADGEAVLVGHSYESSSPTQIRSSDTAFLGQSTGWRLAGVTGEHVGENGFGVQGIVPEGAPGYGVYGSGGEAGTRGVSMNTGVEGVGVITGVRGDGADFGVEGIAHEGGGPDGEGVGVVGSAKRGTGVVAISPLGTALAVTGKASFSRSGRATVAAGRSYVDVDLRTKGGLSGTPLILATLQTYRSGLSVAAARKNYPSTGKFRIYLNKAAAGPTYVAWQVLG